MATQIISRSDARASGLTRYFTGKPCKHGHVAERQVTNGVCKKCSTVIETKQREVHRDKFRDKWKRDAARHRIENPERVNRNKTKWARANPDKVKKNGDRWRKANPERHYANVKRWRAAHPEHIAKKNKAYKLANAERLKPIAIERTKKWQAANPEGVRKNTHTRRARKHNAPGSHTAEEIKQLFERQKFKCAACGTSIKVKRHLDHIVALSRGGSNDIVNLQWLCPSCNCSKHNKDPLVWARENGRLF